MEINLIEEDAKIVIFKGNKTLKYKVKNNGKNINKVPVYMHWLNLMKTEKGENGIITYCTKCHSFLYLDNMQQRHSREHICCDFNFCVTFCEYCGELFNEDSICCLRKSFNMIKVLSYTLFREEFCFGIFFVPIISLIWTFLSIFKIIFSKRIKKTDDINYIDMGLFDTELNFSFFILCILLSIVYSLVFFIPYFFTIYFFQVFLMTKVKRQIEEDKANNIIRY